MICNKVSGEYKVTVLSAEGEELRTTGWFKNLITDTGLNMLAGNAGLPIMYYCFVGTGSAVPANTDTQLASLIGTYSSPAYMNPQGTNLGAPDFNGVFTGSYEFGIGAIVGNITEVGIGPNTDGTGLFSRALIKDINGDPTTISLLATEILQITYRVTFAQDMADHTGTMVINGQTYDLVIRPANASAFTPNYAYSGSSGMYLYAYEGTIQGPTAQPGGAQAGFSEGTADAYIPNSFTWDMNYSMGLNVGNFPTGINTLHALYRFSAASGGSYQYQIGITPPIPKDDTMILNLKLRQTWARA